MSEELARKFHETYERLAPSFGYTTRLGTRQFDPESDNGRLMIAVCDELLRHHAAALEEIARLKEFAEAMADDLRRLQWGGEIRSLAAYRRDYPKEGK